MTLSTSPKPTVVILHIDERRYYLQCECRWKQFAEDVDEAGAVALAEEHLNMLHYGKWGGKG